MKPDGSKLSEFTGDPFEIDELIEYQDGAIVSRTLLDREAATLTVFAVAEGQTISEHTAPHDAFLQLLDGAAKVLIEDETHEVHEGEGLVFPADASHALAAEERFKMLLTMIR